MTALTIERAELYRVAMRLRDSFVAGGVETRERPVLLLRLVDLDGASAWGECVALPTAHYVPETLDIAAKALGEGVLPGLIGRKFETLSEVRAYLSCQHKAGPMARACVEMTCWALVAERDGVPLSGLVGGTRREVAAGLALGQFESSEVLGEAVASGFAEGYQRIKVKIAPGQDVDYLRSTVERYGGEGLMVDANGAYQRADVAIFEDLDEFGLMMIEQPLPADDVEGHAALQRRLRTPLCVDESLGAVEEAEAIIAASAARIANVKPGRVGGFGEALDIEQRCVEAGIALWCGGMLETGVGRAYNVALASRQAYTLPGDLSPSRRYWEEDIVDPVWTMSKRGTIAVPDSPGIGVSVDVDQVRWLSVEIQEFSA